MRIHEDDFRGKAAASVSARFRFRFCKNFKSTTILSSSVVKATDMACHTNPTDLKSKRDAAMRFAAKLSTCLSMLADI